MRNAALAAMCAVMIAWCVRMVQEAVTIAAASSCRASLSKATMQTFVDELTSSSRLTNCSNCGSVSGGRPPRRRLTLTRCQSDLKCSRHSAWLAKLPASSASRPHAKQVLTGDAAAAPAAAVFGAVGCAAPAGGAALQSHVAL